MQISAGFSKSQLANTKVSGDCPDEGAMIVGLDHVCMHKPSSPAQPKPSSPAPPTVCEASTSSRRPQALALCRSPTLTSSPLALALSAMKTLLQQKNFSNLVFRECKKSENAFSFVQGRKCIFFSPCIHRSEKCCIFYCL